MSIPASERIKICNDDGVVIDRVCLSRAHRIALAPNATLVRLGHSRKQKRGTIARIVLREVDDCSLERRSAGNPKRYSFLARTEEVPQGVHTLKHLPDSTEDLYRTVRTECLKEAGESLSGCTHRGIALGEN